MTPTTHPHAKLMIVLLSQVRVGGGRRGDGPPRGVDALRGFIESQRWALQWIDMSRAIAL
jgi:hypothetical protein